jgi:hypothetical protein
MREDLAGLGSRIGKAEKRGASVMCRREEMA